MRINKFLSGCGFDSRRKCESIVTDGRVRVNGKIITDLATDIKDSDKVEVDGKAVVLRTESVYIMLNKPKGCVTTAKDEKSRKTVMDIVKIKERVFPVGRLDYDTEGLLLLTNDGDLTNKITHPKNGITKTYVVKVEGTVSETELKKLRSGIVYGNISYKGAEVRIVGTDSDYTRLEITVTEGKNHEIKNMVEAIGRRVEFLKRIAIGELRLGGLSRGEWRYLNTKEVAYLKSL